MWVSALRLCPLWRRPCVAARVVCGGPGPKTDFGMGEPPPLRRHCAVLTLRRWSSVPRHGPGSRRRRHLVHGPSRPLCALFAQRGRDLFTSSLRCSRGRDRRRRRHHPSPPQCVGAPSSSAARCGARPQAAGRAQPRAGGRGSKSGERDDEQGEQARRGDRSQAQPIEA